MGADMLIAAVRSPQIVGGPSDPAERWNAALAVINSRISACTMQSWSDDSLRELAVNLGADVEADVDETEEDAPSRQHLIDAIHAAVKAEMRQRLLPPMDRGETFPPLFARDVSDARFGGVWYWVTGGLSWGDSPTDSFHIIGALDALGIFDLPINLDGDPVVTRVTPTQSRAHARLEELRAVARRLYNDPAVGRDRLTTAMVAEGAGASIGTVYRYYKSRQEILDDIAPGRDQSPVN